MAAKFAAYVRWGTGEHELKGSNRLASCQSSAKTTPKNLMHFECGFANTKTTLPRIIGQVASGFLPGPSTGLSLLCSGLRRRFFATMVRGF